MPISNFPSGFANGVNIRGVPLEIPHPGKVFWVNNSTVLPDRGIGGSDGNPGTYLKPFLTIDYAIGRCLANRGDIIYVMPGHIETIGAAAAVNFDVDGVTVIGLGRGAKQARLNFTATAGTVVVNADNVSILNLDFRASVSGVVIGLSVLTGSTDLLVKDCVFDVTATGTDEFLISVNLGVGCDRATIEDSFLDMGLGGAAAGVKLVGASAGVTLRRNRITGNYSLANISGITTLSTEVLIEDNLLVQGGTGALNAVAVIALLTGTTGIIKGNYIVCDVATFALQTVASACAFMNNQRTDDVGQAATSAVTSSSVVASGDG